MSNAWPSTFCTTSWLGDPQWNLMAKRGTIDEVGGLKPKKLCITCSTINTA